MAFLNWNESMSVGIPSIDDQHKKLFEMISDFYENIQKRSNNESISKLLQGMKKYTAMHFQTEEKYMQVFNFEGYDEHKAEHDRFVAKILDVEKKFNSGKTVLTFELTNFLRDWIQNHIQGTDKKYSRLLIEKGVK